MKKGRLITNLKDETFLHLDNTESYFTRLRDVHRDVVLDTQKSYLLFAYVTLCASTLEYSLNHLLILHCLTEYGPHEYRRYAESFIKIEFANKLLLTPQIISNSKFKLNKENVVVKSLEELITLRNRILHNKCFAQKIETDVKMDEFEIGMELRYENVNYIEDLTKDRCIKYGEALGEIKRQLLDNYSESGLIASDLLLNHE